MTNPWIELHGLEIQITNHAAKLHPIPHLRGVPSKNEKFLISRETEPVDMINARG